MTPAQLENQNGEADWPEEHETKDHRHELERLKAAKAPIRGGRAVDHRNLLSDGSPGFLPDIGSRPSEKTRPRLYSHGIDREGLNPSRSILGALSSGVAAGFFSSGGPVATMAG
jgi:hypothetical protein